MPEKGQEFVNSEVVNFVPVLVQDIQACLEPLLLAVSTLNALHNLADLLGRLLLVD